MFDDRVYKRGALTLHALRLRFGDAPFFAMLRGWVAAHTAATVTTADFRAYAVSALGDAADALLTRWLDQAPLPPLPRTSARG